MSKKNGHTTYAQQVSEVFLETIPYSLFTALEIGEYMRSQELSVLDFDTEFVKPNFQADFSTLKGLLKRFFVESDSEVGLTHFYEFELWVAQYTHEYTIDQHERIDFYKVAYGTGLAFLDFMHRLEGHSKSKELYIQTVKQMILDALNQLLDHDTGSEIDNTMLQKLRETLHKDKMHTLYGEFGVYSIFRNCSRFWYKLHAV